MAYDAKKKAEVLAAVGVTHTVRSAAKAFKVGPSTIQAWQKEAKQSAQISTEASLPPVAPISQGGGLEPTQPQQPQPVNQPTINQIRTATIANAVLSDIAQARAETIAELLRLRKLAIRRLEDSMLPLRRRKVTHENAERVELDPNYSPPKVDLVGALYMLDGILGIRANEQSNSDDAPPAEVEVRIVRDEPEDNTIQLPQQAKPTGT